MPIPGRSRVPVRPVTRSAVRTSRMGRAGPASVAGLAVIVFSVFLGTTTTLTAVIMAAATVVAGTVLLMLVYGTGRLHRRPRPLPVLRRDTAPRTVPPTAERRSP
ncbi:hypothetical protein [Actinomadura rubrisoli]|uniref:hypothetical protein n=1 Tax=Actinomadura rubrisoli TaxID=2530368 RepID=UPI0014049F2A|nr:hypothetical protein [Actinomadura rubrisoli]